jgi:hypothetical protein
MPPEVFMPLRLATFNVNNLFRRPKVFQLEGMSTQAAKVLDDLQKLEQLLAKSSYSGPTEFVSLRTTYFEAPRPIYLVRFQTV